MVNHKWQFAPATAEVLRWLSSLALLLSGCAGDEWLTSFERVVVAVRDKESGQGLDVGLIVYQPLAGPIWSDEPILSLEAAPGVFVESSQATVDNGQASLALISQRRCAVLPPVISTCPVTLTPESAVGRTYLLRVQRDTERELIEIEIGVGMSAEGRRFAVEILEIGEPQSIELSDARSISL